MFIALGPTHPVVADVEHTTLVLSYRREDWCFGTRYSK